MSNREKIIFALVLIAVMYGGYQFLFPPPSKTASVKAEDEIKAANKLVKDITMQLIKVNAPGPEKYIVSRAETRWTKDPLLPVKETTEDSSLANKKINFTYSGYIEMEKKKIAIINGMEYQTGEELEIGEWIVLGIYPRKVVIGIKGKLDKRTIHLAEELL